MQLADRLKQPLQHIQHNTTSREFVRWMVYLSHHAPNNFDPLHHYLAQIACEVHCVLMQAKDRAKVDYKQFLIKFVAQAVQQAGQTSKEPPAWWHKRPMPDPSKITKAVMSKVEWAMRLAPVGRSGKASHGPGPQPSRPHNADSPQSQGSLQGTQPLYKPRTMRD